jgi:hypothetical protein
MPDQFIKLTGYSRNHAIRLLSEKAGIQATAAEDEKTAVFKPDKKARILPNRHSSPLWGPRFGTV